jgi:pSer/pThr/pTyr-binding forkhead associated (FHA) protein
MKTIKIGRSADNDIVLDKYPTVSGHHATITIDRENGEVFFTDHSTNGSWINGQNVSNKKCRIKGDEKAVLANSVTIDLKEIVGNIGIQQRRTQEPHTVHIPANNSSLNNHEPNRRARRLPTSRGFFKFFFLGLITLGIYQLVVFTNISTEINIVARKDGKKTTNYILMILLSIITLGIYSYVWWTKLSSRIGNELRYRGVDYSFGAKDFWIWNILGSLFIIGPCIYIHKLMKAMNRLNGNYNLTGA